MKKYAIVIFIGLFHLTGLRGQEKMVLDHRGCGFINAPIPKVVPVADPSNEALEYVKRICNITGIGQNFIVKRSMAIANAYSTTDAQNDRIILYNEDFFSSLNSETFKIAVLAHEIGHFLNNNILFDDKNRQQDELAADKFSGTVLARLGLRYDDAIELVRIHCSKYAEGQYPAQSDRIDAFKNGFSLVNGGVNSNFAFNVKQLLYKIDFNSTLQDVLAFEWGDSHKNDIIYDSLKKAIECAGQDVRYYWRYLRYSRTNKEIMSFIQNNNLAGYITPDSYIVYYFKEDKLCRISLRIFANSHVFERLFFQSIEQDTASYPFRFQYEENGIHFISGSSFTDVRSTELHITNEDGYKMCVHDWWH